MKADARHVFRVERRIEHGLRARLLRLLLGVRCRAAANEIEIAELRVARIAGAHHGGSGKGFGQLAFIGAVAHCTVTEIFRLDMAEIGTSEIGDRKLAEHIVENGGRILDAVIALHQARRLEAGEGEGLHIFLQRHAILKAERDGDGEIVHQRAEGRAFLVHVDEDFADLAVIVLAGAQIDFVAADQCLLRIALATVGQTFSGALHDTFHHTLGDHAGTLLRRRGDDAFGHAFLFRFVQILVFENLRVERLGKLGAVAVERIGFEAQLPGKHIGLVAFLYASIVRHVDRLGDRAGDEGLRRRHHADMAFDREIALARAAARVGAIEDRQMLVFEMRRALKRHRAANMKIGRFDFRFGETDGAEQVEIEIVHLVGIEAQHLRAELFAQRPFVEDEANVESGRERPFHGVDFFIGEALGAERGVVHARRIGQCAVADRISDDLLDLLARITKRIERLRHGAIDDLEITAACELLEFHQREIGFDAGRVAIHHKADRACGRDHACLRIAITVGFAHGAGEIPCGPGMVDQVALRTVLRIERHRCLVDAFIA